MQDISELPEWQPEKFLAHLRENPLTIKSMKVKLDRIYMINSYNQRQYLNDVIDAYCWIKLVASTEKPEEMFQNEKTMKFFIEQFVFTSIKYMELCRTFKMIQMMVFTQQMMVEGLRLFMRYFDQLEKYPRMTFILKHTFDFEKQFFKINYSNQYHNLVVPPTKDEVETITTFVTGLKSGDRVDVLKCENQSKRVCWLPGTYVKSSTLYIAVRCDNDRANINIDLNNLQVRPPGSMKQHYEWRFNLKVGDKVDYLKDSCSWIKTQIQDIRETTQQIGDKVNKYTEVKIKDDVDCWISISDSRIQKLGMITRMRPDNRVQQQFFFEDYNDYILDPEMKQQFVTRSEISKSLMIIDFLKIADNQLHMFQRISKVVKEKSMKIEVVAELINFILLVSPLFHRKFAVQYLTDFTESILDYINNGKQGTIRNFSKQRYEAVITSIQQFMKRLYTTTERKTIIQRLQLDLILRFLFSDFLDRKLQAVALLTNFFKMCRHNITRKTLKQFIQWVKQNKILQCIYNDKSHSQLISKSSDFLKYYLETNPQIQQLQPLLIWNQAIIKLVAENFEELPPEIQNVIVEKIKTKSNVTNSDALTIIKKTPGCQAWLLKNGGQCWVEVVREKPKRRPEIVEVFKQPFVVVNKITKQMNDLFESNFKSTYFSYMFQINYLCTVLENDEINLSQKLEFITLAIDLIKKISDQVFELLLKFLINSSTDENVAEKYQKFFVNVMPKLHTSHLQRLFIQKFSKRQQLQKLTQTQFTIFEKCFVGINDNIQEEKYSETFSNGKKVIMRHYVLISSIQQLEGIQKLQEIVFYSKDAEISKRAIKFIGSLLTSVKSEQMKEYANQYINRLLKVIQDQLYSASEDEDTNRGAILQEKHLKIIEELVNQTQTRGVDEVPSVNALFPPQKIQLKLIDNFNTTRTKFYLGVPSSMTLFQFRSEICKHINAYVPETKLIVNGIQLSPRYNGHVIHVLELNGDIVIGRVHDTPRVNLVDQQGRLVDKARIIFQNIFKQFSSFGLMSKKQCLKYHQKCVGGDGFSQGEAKVEKIYDQYDRDKDGYLTESDFLAFYQTCSKTKQSSVWSNLQSFGVRNDLEILDSLPIQYPDRDQLARNNLFDNQKFMKILFNLLCSPKPELAGAAWKLAARLPLYQKFHHQLDLNKQYPTRYWLYVVESKRQFEKITTEVLSKVLNMSVQTACIGLKVALQCESIDIEIFNIISDNLKKSNSLENTNFFDKVILDYSLKNFSKFLIKDQKIVEYYVNNEQLYNKIFRQGMMSVNQSSREAFCHTLSELIELAVEKDFKLFESLFNLIYRIFDNCELSTLTMEYFELFSHLLETLKLHHQLMPKLGLNWGSLTQQIIEVYKSHECTETSMTSKPDQVAEGLLKIIAKLLNSDTIEVIVNLVPFIFQQSLFPDKGRNKLKTAKSRQDAYELIYQICRFQSQQGKLSGGLLKLFEAGFKDIYKKMSSKKTTEVFSYYYSYNQSRSELGYAGIRNLGCICYMISMLQQLYMTVPFRNLVLMADDGEPQCLVKRGTKQIDDNIFHQLKNMFGYLLLTEKQEYNPDQFCFSFKDFEGQPVNTSIQQDAQQFLNIFFDKLQTSLKNTPFKHIFENIFGGKSCSQTTCSGCGAVKERSQNFYPLSLQIKGFKNIQQSLNKYTTGQIIQDYQCDGCKNKCDVTKRSFLQKTPNYFIIHLQRMCFNYDRLENEKVNSRWQFPQELNVYNYTLSKEKGLPQNNGQFSYKLKGIVLHYGTADFGHYFSYIKESQNQWIQFNDQRVREFDPSDIQIQCYGGEHWRRESQSAYLLVYERQQKSDLILQFNNEAQKKKILEQFKLTQAVVQQNKEAKNQSQSQVSKIDSVTEEMSQDHQKEEKQTQNEASQSQKGTEKGQGKQTQKRQEPKILVHLDMRKIIQIVPKNIKDKIDQENDQFSFTLNLSNNQFASFIHNILSINPPEKLKQEYLELCYQCLNLKQSIKTSQGKLISVSQWATQRFMELIQDHGWEFMKSFGQNWESDILNIDKSTRTVTKCLLQCAVTDIIKSNNFNSEFQETEQQSDNSKAQKRNVVMNFLDKLSEMMLNEVVKHWTRFAEYFELWIAFVKQNQFVRRYCEEKMIVEKILDFVMEQGYPYPRAKKRHQMGNQYYSAQFEYPLGLMHALLQNGYELNQMQQKCLRTYAFMDKIICHRVEGAKIIETLCKNNNVISQKMGYLLLTNCSNVQQSDQVKPIIASILQYLKIDDHLKQKRVEWIIGFPTYVQHVREKGFGSYGCIPSSQSAVNYISALGTSPILQQIMKFKKKTQHVTALLISMILQLEHDGLINNLDEYPGKKPLEKTYTSQFQAFVDKYYQQTQRPYTAKSYTQYGQRLQHLWQQRPNRAPINPFPQVLLGKVIQETLVKQQTIEQIFEIRQYNIKVNYLPLNNDQANKLTGKNIISLKSNTNFICPNLPKQTKSMGHYNFMKVNSSDEQQADELPQESVFDGTKEGWLLRKIQIVNHSSYDKLSVFGVADHNACNLHVPISQLSVSIQSNSKLPFILMKKDIQADYGELNITFNILGDATASGYLPRQIITEVDQKVEYNKVNNSDDEDEDEDYPTTTSY